MEIVIRQIKIEDANDFQIALDSVAREKKFLSFVNAPAIDEVQKYIETSIKNAHPHVVAEHNQKIVGFADFKPYGREGYSHVATLGMGVISEYRNQGIGTKLLATVIDLANQSGFIRLELEVFSTNTKAIALYENFGFLQEGIRKKVRHMDGQYDDLMMMAKITPLTL